MIWSRIWLLTWVFRLTKLHSRIRESQQAQKYRLPTTWGWWGCNNASFWDPSLSSKGTSRSHRVWNAHSCPQSFWCTEELVLILFRYQYCPGLWPSFSYLLKSHLMLMTSRSVSLDSQPIFSFFLKFLLGYPTDILNSTGTNLLDLSPYSSVNGISQPQNPWFVLESSLSCIPYL